MRHLLFLLVMVSTVLSASADRFYVKNFLISPGETREVNILLENATEYTAFQCDLHVPAGLSIKDDSFALTNRKSSSHTLEVSKFGEGIYRLMSYSLKLKNYTGNSGALVTFEVTANEEFNTSAMLVISNTLFTTENSVEITFEDEECCVGLRGDVDLDGLVGISDVSTLVDYLLGSDVEVFSANNADLDEDGNVEIGDLSILIDLLLAA